MKKIKTCPWCGKRPKPKKATKVGEVLACNNKKCALQGLATVAIKSTEI